MADKAAKTIGSEWIDIIEPLTPATEIHWFILLLILSVVLAAIYLIYKWYQQPLPHARMQLARLKRLASHTDGRQTALQLARTLHRLSETTRLKPDQVLRNRLDTCCYAAESITPTEAIELVTDIQNWLSQNRSNNGEPA